MPAETSSSSRAVVRSPAKGESRFGTRGHRKVGSRALQKTARSGAALFHHRDDPRSSLRVVLPPMLSLTRVVRDLVVPPGRAPGEQQALGAGLRALGRVALSPLGAVPRTAARLPELIRT